MSGPPPTHLRYGSAVSTPRRRRASSLTFGFQRIVAWARSAEVLAEYGRGGREVCVEGRLAPKLRDLDGRRVKQVDLVVETVQLIGAAAHVGRPADGEA